MVADMRGGDGETRRPVGVVPPCYGRPPVASERRYAVFKGAVFSSASEV